LVAIETISQGRPAHPRGANRDPAAWRVERLTVSGIGISAILEPGRGHPIVFLHGNSSTKAVWANQIAAVKRQGRAVLAPDLPGHGESEDARDPEATYSLPGYAAVVSGLIDRTQWTSVDIVGWSLGGHIGLELLATDPRIRSLLIVGTPPGRPSAEAMQQAFHASADMQLAAKADFTDADARAYGTAMMGGPEHLTDDLLACVKRTDGNARAHLFASAYAGIGSDQRRTVETLDKPLCVVHGAREPFVRLEYLCSLGYRALWNNRVHVIREAGHAPHWECPAVFNDILLNFHEFAAGCESAA
jgi:pimeloyl-ACP methyl ester carboxylesterase